MQNETFLSADGAVSLYREYASDQPIVDYHNHLSPADLKENRRYRDLYELWLQPDPYKHRAMRMAGIPERSITGDASGEEKFFAWCSIFPDLIGNPLYQWSLAELSLFGIEETPSKETAASILKRGNDFLSKNTVTPLWFLDRFRVEKICPCHRISDPVPESGAGDRVVPSLRADEALLPEKDWIEAFGASSLSEFLQAVKKKIEAFYRSGCRFADHALDDGFSYLPDDKKNEARFERILKGDALSKEDSARLSSYLLTRYLNDYAEIGMVLQLHIGAKRDTSSRLRRLAGKAGGYAAAGNECDLASLSALFDAAERRGDLPKTILFPLNPADNAKLATLSGSFARDGVKGLITLGPAWWWNDHRLGMRKALEEIEANSLLSGFVGMTTDSRSFLSLVRHDAFRRVLCDYLAKERSDHALFCSRGDLGRLIRKMVYQNASDCFREV